MLPSLRLPCRQILAALLLCAAILPARADHTVNGVPGVIKPTDITQENYGRDVEDFWATHKYNPASPNYDVTVPTRPGGELLAVPNDPVNGNWISRWIVAASSANKTLVLPPGSTWNAGDVIKVDNVHVICKDPNNKASIIGMQRFWGVADWTAAYNDRAVIYNPMHNYYFKNIKFDGGARDNASTTTVDERTTTGTWYCLQILETHDILFDGCEFINAKLFNPSFLWMGLNPHKT